MKRFIRNSKVSAKKITKNLSKVENVMKKLISLFKVMDCYRQKHLKNDSFRRIF